MNHNKLNVTVVGGGNSAHILIPFLTEASHQVSLMTRRPDEWKETIFCDLTRMDGTVTKTFNGKCKRSNDPALVIPDADAIILCMPVHQYRNALGRIAPHINRKKIDVFVGTVYGQAGFNWMVHEMEQEHNLTNISSFAFGLIPWICRTITYGQRAANYGGKQMNICAVNPASKFDKLNEVLLNDISLKPLGVGKCVQACSFLSLTLSVDNQIIHPSRCFGLWKRYGCKWDSLDEVPYFYRDFDDVSANILSELDKDYSAVRAAVRQHFPDRPFTYMLSYLDLQGLTHSAQYDNMKASFKESEQLGLIKIPTVDNGDGARVLDIHCRFFTDDIPYGLLVAKWVAQKLNIDTPHVDEVILWAQRMRDEHWLNEDKTIDMDYCMAHKELTGLPPAYGIFSVDDILD